MSRASARAGRAVYYRKFLAPPLLSGNFAAFTSFSISQSFSFSCCVTGKLWLIDILVSHRMAIAEIFDIDGFSIFASFFLSMLSMLRAQRARFISTISSLDLPLIAVAFDIISSDSELAADGLSRAACFLMIASSGWPRLGCLARLYGSA